VCLLDEQFHITDLGGTMRLGSYACNLQEGSRAHQAYGSTLIHERHRHRYELNNLYRRQLEEKGFLVTGASPDGNLVEVIELRDHPWFLAVQCHPEFKSKPIKAHPLFREFVQASLKQRERRKNGGMFRSRSQITSLSGS
jgi:CTP synthase